MVLEFRDLTVCQFQVEVRLNDQIVFFVCMLQNVVMGNLRMYKLVKQLQYFSVIVDLV